ncbi:MULTISPECIES: serine/threonine-protein kinase [Sorangium]|uniref:Protein kinase n=1 Tax=Sorangium cellulosum TaxID=56 RepID=A0A4P2QDX6_SORCE|nr:MULTISPECIES: serine/threonine-protein kinase [Sorangium]AUX28007.1 protein kinase [Sorangium cellulosum]WCQ87412.1 serine-threonine kinase [Sorangium sp. Soce836]
MTTKAFGLEGQVLVGRYRLIRPLSSGSMGTVWRADDLTLGSPVAIKMLGPLYAKDETVRARFYQEAQAAAALRSPHVVQILDHGVDNDVPFIAMELLEGEDLAHRLQRVGPLSPAEAARIFADVARAVRKAHDAGIVHRDLKPDNIFLARDDDREVAKVLDFGVAKTRLYGSEGLGTQAGVLIGTLPYMSPEQAQGANVDYRSDLWALGVIAFECVCGRAAITAEAPGAMILEICSDPLPVPSKVARVPVPPAFDEWFLHACSRDPSARFPSATAMGEALREALLPGGEAQEAGRASLISAPAPAPAVADAGPSSVPPASAAPASAALASPAPASAAPASAAPASAAPTSAAPASAPPVSVSPGGGTASPPVVDEGAEADWPPRRTAPVTALVLGLAASVLGVALFVGWRALGSDPSARQLPSGAASSPTPALEARAAAPPANAPPAEAAPASGAPEIAPSREATAASAAAPSAPADSAAPARASRAPAAAASWAAAAPARPSKAAPSAQRTRAPSAAAPSASGAARPSASGAARPSTSSEPRTKADRLGF